MSPTKIRNNNQSESTNYVTKHITESMSYSNEVRQQLSIFIPHRKVFLMLLHNLHGSLMTVNRNKHLKKTRAKILHNRCTKTNEISQIIVAIQILEKYHQQILFNHTRALSTKRPQLKQSAKFKQLTIVRRSLGSSKKDLLNSPRTGTGASTRFTTYNLCWQRFRKHA